MFKKLPALKTSSPLKSSERRKLLAHLQLAYPVLAHAPPEILARLVPDGLRQANALTSGEDKCCFYTDDDGVPLWIELGGHVGVALSAGKGNKNKAGGGGGGGKKGAASSNAQPRAEGEVIPTLNALWIHPFILPQLPTWSAVIEDHLLGGSALMVPGLRMPPHTFRACPLELPKPESTEGLPSEPSGPALPAVHTLVSITASHSFVPLVVGRLELSGEKLIELRNMPDGKGKAARVVHSFKDTIWEMGGKLKPPADSDFDLSALVQAPEGDAKPDADQAPDEAGQGELVEGADASTVDAAEESTDPSARAPQEEQEDLAAALEAVLLGADAADDEEPEPTDAEQSGRKGKGKGKKGKKMDRRGHAEEATQVVAGPSQEQDDQAQQAAGSGPSLSSGQVDVILRLALLDALASLSTEAVSNLLPLPASSLYSAHVLPHRPSHLPPRVGKGKGKARAAWEGWATWKTRTSTPVGDVDEDDEVVVPADEADVKRSSSKQLKKWIKAAEKDGLLKTKEVRGELNVVDLNLSHSELQNWAPIWRIADEAAKAAAAEQDQEGGDGQSAAGPKKSKGSPDRMGILMQAFYGAKSDATRELFEVIGLDPDSVQSASSLRAALSDYITKRALAHPTNQALVRPGDDPALVLALTSTEGGKSKKKGDAAKADAAPAALPELKPMRRDEVAKKLQDVMQEFHRQSCVRQSTANAILSAQAREDPLSLKLIESDDFKASLKEGESIGPLSRGKPVPISVSIKQRQGRKTVTLVSGLEPYGVDPKALATELSREVGASTSVSSLPGSTAKKPKVEVLVQGDVRKALFKFLEEEAGIDVARLVSVKDDVGKKK